MSNADAFLLRMANRRASHASQEKHIYSFPYYDTITIIMQTSASVIKSYWRHLPMRNQNATARIEYILCVRGVVYCVQHYSKRSEQQPTTAFPYRTEHPPHA